MHTALIHLDSYSLMRHFNTHIATFSFTFYMELHLHIVKRKNKKKNLFMGFFKWSKKLLIFKGRKKIKNGTFSPVTNLLQIV